MAHQFIAPFRKIVPVCVYVHEGGRRVVERNHFAAYIIFEEVEKLRVVSDLMTAQIDMADSASVDRSPGSAADLILFENQNPISEMISVEGF
jgi:hypothetical protein